jgi:hypothetical protein
LRGNVRWSGDQRVESVPTLYRYSEDRCASRQLIHEPGHCKINCFACTLHFCGAARRDCHLDTSRKRCTMTDRDPNPVDSCSTEDRKMDVPQETEHERQNSDIFISRRYNTSRI